MNRSHASERFGVYDGYELGFKVAEEGYRMLTAWGLSGWDLGDYPLTQIGIRGPYLSPDGRHVTTVLEYCEGDITETDFDNYQQAITYIDGIALWFWKTYPNRGPGNIPEDATLDTIPAEYRGKFSWDRLDAERADRIRKEA